MRVRNGGTLLTWSLLAGSIVAQQKMPQRGLEELQRQDLPTIPCPFAAPRLTSADPAEVAWAAERLTRDDGKSPQTVAELRTALAAMRRGDTEEHRRAVLHLLHNALQKEVPLPVADLRFEPEGRTRIPWIALQARGAAENGRDLFELFRRLDERTDAAWEVVGGALAIRGHGTFAIELRMQMQPCLRVRAGVRPAAQDRAVGRDDMPVLLDGFPRAPAYYWERDKMSLVAADFLPNRGTATKECSIDEVHRERARLRWLARLAGEPDPVAWAARFDAMFRERDMAKFEAFAQDAERRARDSLTAADAALRRRFKLPERLALPVLKVVYEDLRREAERKAQPMPERK